MVNGRLEEGLKHIDAALRINPDAHFGREKYQKKLAEYVISRKTDGKVPQPLVGLNDPHGASFRLFLIVPSTATTGPRIEKGDREAAVKAVLGMMRFATTTTRRCSWKSWVTYSRIALALAGPR